VDDEARITKALRRRGTSMLCPACNFVLRGPIGAYRLIPEGGDDAKGIKVSVYGCSNCGYVRLHSANVIGKLE
jgi:predicted RNA-binding Zn-ribbon protein involved in translation (DUF1610 family)